MVQEFPSQPNADPLPPYSREHCPRKRYSIEHCAREHRLRHAQFKRLFETCACLKHLFESNVRLYFVPRGTLLASTCDETSRFTLCMHCRHPWNIPWNIIQRTIAKSRVFHALSVEHYLLATADQVNAGSVPGWKFPTHLLDSEKLKLDGFDCSWLDSTP
jgi:hypothetical protein